VCHRHTLSWSYTVVFTVPPGTKRVARVEENIAADGIELTAEQIDKLNNLTPAAGDHHNEAQMQMLDR